MANPKRGERPVSTGRRRADAVANRAKVVAAAGEAFTAEGLDVSLDEIARRAGVGAGTVHRHFSTKAELVNAVLAAAIEDLVVVAESYASSERAGAALRDFLVHLVTKGAAAHELAARLQAGAGRTSTPPYRWPISIARWESCCPAPATQATSARTSTSGTWPPSWPPPTRPTSIHGR